MMKTRKNNSGVTFVEMMIGVAIFSTIAIFVSLVTLKVAQESKNALSQVPAQDQTYRTMDFVRNRILPAEFGSVQISVDKTTIAFRNRSMPERSNIIFDPDEEVCIYDPDITVQGDEVNWGRKVRGEFDFGDNPRRIIVKVSCDGVNHKNEDLTFTKEEEITIRN